MVYELSGRYVVQQLFWSKDGWEDINGDGRDVGRLSSDIW